MKYKHIKIYLITILFLICNVVTANAFDYKEALKRNSLVPCYTEVAQKFPTRLTNVIGVQTMVEVYLMWFEKKDEHMIQILVDGFPELKTGKIKPKALGFLYSEFKQSCIDAMMLYPHLMNQYPHYPLPDKFDK